jgi:coenzyme A diphosphatase NUDT7
MDIKEFEDIFANRKPKPYGTYSYYSVLVPLVEKDGALHVLFEVRADGLKRQPGEVCFPGGRLEKKETPMAGAIRETAEELNIPAESIRIINELDYIYTYSNFTLYSFLGVIDYNVIKKTIISEDEVKEIFLVPFDFFMDNEPFIKVLEISPVVEKDFPYAMINLKNTYNWRKGKSTVPIYRYKEHVIWGLTGKIMHNLVHIIKCYQTNKEKCIEKEAENE